MMHIINIQNYKKKNIKYIDVHLKNTLSVKLLKLLSV